MGLGDGARMWEGKKTTPPQDASLYENVEIM